MAYGDQRRRVRREMSPERRALIDREDPDDFEDLDGSGKMPPPADYDPANEMPVSSEVAGTKPVVEPQKVLPPSGLGSPFDEIDELMDRAHTRRREIEDQLDAMRKTYIDGGLRIPPVESTRVKYLIHERDEIQKEVLNLLNSSAVPEGYLDHYNERFGYPKATATAQEKPEGAFWKLLKGIPKGIAEIAEHPVASAGTAIEGFSNIMTMPGRLVERGMRDIPGAAGAMTNPLSLLAAALSGKRGTELDAFTTTQGHISDAAKWLRGKAGMEEHGPGHIGAEMIGGAAVPLPSKAAGWLFKRGETLKNTVKGATAGAGYAEAESLANRGEVASPEVTGASAGVGGGLNLLLSLLTRGKVHAPTSEVPPAAAPGKTTAEAPPHSGPETTTAVNKPKATAEATPGASVPPPAPAPGEPAAAHAAPKPGEMPASQVSDQFATTPPTGIKQVLQKAKGMPEAEQPTVGSGAPGSQPHLLEEAAPTSPLAQAAADIKAGRVTSVAEAPQVDIATGQPKPLDKLLRRPEPAAEPQQAALPFEEAKPVVAPEAPRQPVAAPQGRQPGVAPSAEAEAMRAKTQQAAQQPLAKVLEEAEKIDAETKAAADELVLGDVLSGKQDVNKIKPKRGAKKGSKSEAPAPAVEGEVGALEAQQDVEVLLGERPKPRAASVKIDKGKPTTLERYAEQEGMTMQHSGDQVELRHADGTLAAKGDRETVVAALSDKAKKEKGLRLYSFPTGVDELAEMLQKTMDKYRHRGKAPEGVKVTNDPHKDSILNRWLRPFETPEFNVRKSKAGTEVVDAARDADRAVETRVRDLIMEPQTDGSYKPTRLHSYFSLPGAQRENVNKALVLGDKLEVVFTPEQLARQGLSVEEISAYQGVRESLDKIHNWVKELGPDEATKWDSRKLVGYIPRVWEGQWEIYIGGKKWLDPKDNTSTFKDFAEAAAAAHRLKKAYPEAKMEIKHHADPEYLGGNRLMEARLVGRLKSKLDAMGKLDAAAIDEAFNKGKDLSGFTKHLMKRRDEEGYETQGLDRILNKYFYGAARKIEMKNLRTATEEILRDHKADLSPSQVQYLREYVEKIGGKPLWDEIFIKSMFQDTALGKFINPTNIKGVFGGARNLATHLSLGVGNVGWAVLNIDTLTRHVWPFLNAEARALGMSDQLASDKYLLKAIGEFYQNKGLRQKLAHNGVIDIQHMSEKTPEIGHRYGEGTWSPARISMAVGTAVEEFVRGVSAIARYRMALDAGRTEAQAMSEAAKFVEQTSGRYTRGGKPPVFTSEVGATAGLFKTYMMVMLQNGWKAFEGGAHGDIGTLTRYLIGSVGVSGLLGLVPGIEDLDQFVTQQFGVSPVKMLQESVPEGMATGLFSVLGSAIGEPELDIDLSRRAGVPEIFPNDVQSWAGPVVGRLMRVAGDVWNLEGEQAFKDLLPTSLRNIWAVMEEPGKVKGRLDKTTTRVTPTEAVLHAVGAPPKHEVREQRAYSYNENMKQYRESKLDHLTRLIVDGEASPDQIREFQELGGTRQRVKNERQRRDLTALERQRKHLPKVLRKDYLVE